MTFEDDFPSFERRGNMPINFPQYSNSDLMIYCLDKQKVKEAIDEAYRRHIGIHPEVIIELKRLILLLGLK